MVNGPLLQTATAAAVFTPAEQATARGEPVVSNAKGASVGNARIGTNFR